MDLVKGGALVVGVLGSVYLGGQVISPNIYLTNT